MKQVTIIGLGLIGGSLAKALRCEDPSIKIVGWTQQMEEKIICERENICNQVCQDLEIAVRDSDVVIVCTPPHVIAGFIEECLGKLKTGAIIMDVGSTKGSLCQEVSKLTKEIEYFIGAHPMAGSEKSGILHAQGDLFSGKVCFLTPTKVTAGQTRKTAKLFWELLKMKVFEVSPEEHDNIVACVSHLPHIVASALCMHLKQEEISWGKYVGEGFKDMTRIAKGSPDLWIRIIEQNQNLITRQLESFKEVIESILRLIQTERYEKVYAFLKDSKAVREDLE